MDIIESLLISVTAINTYIKHLLIINWIHEIRYIHMPIITSRNILTAANTMMTYLPMVAITC